MPRAARTPASGTAHCPPQSACEEAGVTRLDGCDLYVTVEPCVMCYGAAGLHHIARLVYGAASPKFGACGGLTQLHPIPGAHHTPVVLGGVCAEAAGGVMRDFFAAKR